MLRAIAIDDEPLALEVLQQHAAAIHDVLLERTFTDAERGISHALKNKPDVLFLDIKMQDRNGLQIARLLPPDTQIVFTTAYAAFAIEGFELNATDYLLKPITLERFIQACNKVKNNLLQAKEVQELFIKENGVWQKIKQETILYIEAQGNYLKLVARDKNYLVRQTLHEFERQLPEYFVKTHKSYIINIRYVDRLEPQQVTIEFYNIPVSDSYRKELFNRMGLKTKG